MRKLYRRYTSLDRARRRLVVEAGALVVLAWVGLRVLRFLTLRRLIDRYVIGTAAAVGRASSAPTATAIGSATSGLMAVGAELAPPLADRAAVVDAIRWAIGAAGRRLPWATCLVQALAADAMLRRRGIGAELRFGVRLLPNGHLPIEGHAWVECEGGATIGAADEASPFAVLTEARSR
jgi:hypothetical protein